jgi:hypothetical protein
MNVLWPHNYGSLTVDPLKLQAVTSAYATATTPTTIHAETSDPIRGSTIRSATRLGGKTAFRFRRRNTIF